jgi:hypothetical protein
MPSHDFIFANISLELTASSAVLQKQVQLSHRLAERIGALPAGAESWGADVYILSLAFTSRAAVVGIALAVVGCAGVSDEPLPYMASSGMAVQPYPSNYRADLTAFMRTYLNDPGAVRDAIIAEPLQRSIGGRQRYIACVRYTATGKGDGNAQNDRAALFLDGRLERLIEKAKDLCANATYVPFPEMEKLSR